MIEIIRGRDFLGQQPKGKGEEKMQSATKVEQIISRIESDHIRIWQQTSRTSGKTWDEYLDEKEPQINLEIMQACTVAGLSEELFAQMNGENLIEEPVTQKPIPVSVKMEQKEKGNRSVHFKPVNFDLSAEFFETVGGQYALWGLFAFLTLLDLITNVWALTGSLDVGIAMEKATIWHWGLGLALVFTEEYVGLSRALWRRTTKDKASKVIMLVILFIVVYVAVVYDFVATLLPPYNAIGGVGGAITGLLLAAMTTVGSSLFIEQTVVVIHLLRHTDSKSST